jgi:hypothetical protein
MDEATQCLVDGLTEIENAAGATLVWNAGTYPCVGGAEFADKLLGSGGLKITADVTTVVRAALFPDTASRPQEEQTALYKSTPAAAGRPVRIKSITLFREAFIVLACVDLNQGA